MGFEFNSRKNNKYELIKSAILIYRKLNDNLRIPHSYVIPYDRPEWPEVMWGMRLGRTASNMRKGLIYKDMEDDLFNLLNQGFCLE